MPHYYWVYRRRAEGEAVEDSERQGRREYQNLRPLFVDRWPGLRFRSLPAEGAGVKITITLALPQSAVDRFVAECLAERNKADPNARLEVERFTESKPHQRRPRQPLAASRAV